MINFMCQFDLDMGLPDEMLFLGVSVREFPDEISI